MSLFYASLNNGLERKGFKVDKYRASDDSDTNDLRWMIVDGSKSKTLHGLYFWGHGDYNGLKTHGTHVYQRSTESPSAYKLGLTWVFACEACKTQKELGSGAKGSNSKGHNTGLRIPFPPGNGIGF